jgi:dethiobiotin synthetase
MTAFFVTGSGTDIGKTYVCAGLLRLWRARGLSPTAFKPAVSGFDDDAAADSDPAALLAALGLPADPASIEAIAPFRLRAPLSLDQAAAMEGRCLTLDVLTQACRAARAKAYGPLLIEGAGGVMSPLNDSETMLDLVRQVGAPVLFVTGSYLGALSHALTGLASLAAGGATVQAVVVNESVEGSVGLEETVASLRRHYAAAPVAALPREGSEQAWRSVSAALGVE